MYLLSSTRQFHFIRICQKYLCVSLIFTCHSNLQLQEVLGKEKIKHSTRRRKGRVDVKKIMIYDYDDNYDYGHDYDFDYNYDYDYEKVGWTSTRCSSSTGSDSSSLTKS